MNSNYKNDIRNSISKHNYLWGLIIIWFLLIVISVTRIISYSGINDMRPLSFIIWVNIIRWSIVVASVFIIYKISHLYKKYDYAVLYHFISSLIFAIVITVLFTLPGQLYFNGLALDFSDFKRSTLFNFQGLVVVIPILYALTVGYYYYKLNLEEYTKEKVNEEKIEKDLIEAKLAVFRSQLDPHFLFNTLQGINTLIETDQDRAKLVLGYLSNILKLMKIRKDEMEIELKEELKFVDFYLKIEKIRYPDILFIEKDISNDSLSVMIPTYSIQLLVENAVKHSISKSLSAELIKISAEKIHDTLQITVENSAQSFMLESVEKNNGIGLTNIKSRLERMYKKSKFEISKSELGGLKVQLCIPFDTKTKAVYYENY